MSTEKYFNTPETMAAALVDLAREFDYYDTEENTTAAAADQITSAICDLISEENENIKALISTLDYLAEYAGTELF